MSKHRRNIPADSAPAVACACFRPIGGALHMVTVRQGCPAHDPQGYVTFMAKHCPDSVFPVDRDPWSGRS